MSVDKYFDSRPHLSLIEEIPMIHNLLSTKEEKIHFDIIMDQKSILQIIVDIIEIKT